MKTTLNRRAQNSEGWGTLSDVPAYHDGELLMDADSDVGLFACINGERRFYRFTALEDGLEGVGPLIGGHSFPLFRAPAGTSVTLIQEEAE